PRRPQNRLLHRRIREVGPIDQLEELFRFENEVGRDEAELFVRLIDRATARDEDASDAGVDLHVIVTMQSEFLGECDHFSGFADTIDRTQYLVSLMNEDELIRAVRRPAQMFGGFIDERDAEWLISSVRGNEDMLGLLWGSCSMA
ncbi:MAG TPA: hypothetical protein VEH77_14090, partial [Roseiarcus sp.]|nr:hypothetical protein [Roseiarcus sp.]